MNMNNYYISRDVTEKIRVAIGDIARDDRVSSFNTVAIKSCINLESYSRKAMVLGSHIVKVDDNILVIYFYNTKNLDILSDKQLTIDDESHFSYVIHENVEVFDLRGLSMSGLTHFDHELYVRAGQINLSGVDLSGIKSLDMMIGRLHKLEKIDLSYADISGLNKSYGYTVNGIFRHATGDPCGQQLTVDMTGLKMADKDRLYYYFKSLEADGDIDEDTDDQHYEKVEIIGYTPANGTNSKEYYHFITDKNANIRENNVQTSNNVKVPKTEDNIKLGHLYYKDKIYYIVLSRDFVPVDISISNSPILTEPASYYCVLPIHTNMLDAVKNVTPLKLSELSEKFDGLDIAALTSFEIVRLTSKAKDFGQIISEFDCGRIYDIYRHIVATKPCRPNVGDTYMQEYKENTVVARKVYAIYLGKVDIEQPVNGVSKLHASLILDRNSKLMESLNETKEFSFKAFEFEDKPNYTVHLRLSTTIPCLHGNYLYTFKGLPADFDAIKDFAKFWDSKTLTLTKDKLTIEYADKELNELIDDFDINEGTSDVLSNVNWAMDDEAPEQKEKRIQKFNERKQKFIAELDRLRKLAEDIMTEKCEYSIWDCINYNKANKFKDSQRVVSASSVIPVINNYDYITSTKIGLVLVRRSDTRLALQIGSYTSTSVPIFDKYGIMHRADESKKLDISDIVAGGIYTTETGSHYMYVGVYNRYNSETHVYFMVTDKMVEELKTIHKSSELLKWLKAHGRVKNSTREKPRKFWKKVCQCITEFDIPENEIAEKVLWNNYN